MSLGSVIIPQTIKPGSVYYLSMDSFDTNEPHYFVVLNFNPKTDEFLFLVNATSRVQKKMRRIILNNEDKRTLVEVSSSQCNFLKKSSSVFDCNNVEKRNMDYLIDQCDKGLCKYKGEVDSDVLKKLRDGVALSRTVSIEAQEAVALN